MSFSTTTVPAIDPKPLETSYRLRWLSGVLLLLALAFPAFYHSAIAIGTLRNIPVLWLPDSLPLKSDFFEFVERFRITDVLLVSWPGCQLDSDSLKAAAEEFQLLSTENVSEGVADETERAGGQSEFLDRFRSLCNDPRPINWARTGTQLRDQLKAPPLNFSELSATRRLTGTMIGNDGKQTCLMISLGMSTLNQHRVILPLIRQRIATIAHVDSEQIAMVGGPVDGAAVDEESIRSIARFSIPASLAAALLCFISLRAFWLSATVLGVATIAQGLVLASTYYMGFEMNAILIMLPPLVFVLTVSTGIHLSNYFLELINDTDMSRLEAARLAMDRGIGPCLMCTLTTVLGLLSLLTVRLVPVQVFGVCASIVLMGSIALLLWMLPGAMIMTWSRSDSKKKESVHLPFLRRFAQVQWLKPKPVISLFFVVAIIVGYGLGHLESTISVPRMFREDSEITKGYRWYEANMGATLSGDLLIQFPISNNESIDLLDELDIVSDIQTEVGKIVGVGGTLSAVNFLPAPPRSRDMRATVARGVIRQRVQDEKSEISQMGFVSSQDGNRTWRITLRLFQQDGAALSSLLSNIKSAANEKARIQSDRVDAPILAKATGHIVVVHGAQELLLEDLKSSFLMAILLIAVLMAIYLKSVVGGLLSLLPNVVPTITLFGMMGWLSSPLDIGSIMTASLALGIAIDDSVHLISRYRSNRGIWPDRRSAAIAALRECFWAMLQTTVVCGLSLLVYRLSDFIPTQRFAIFMLGLLVIAFIGVTLLLPAMMMTRLGDFFAKSKWSTTSRPARSD